MQGCARGLGGSWRFGCRAYKVGHRIAYLGCCSKERWPKATKRDRCRWQQWFVGGLPQEHGKFQLRGAGV